MASTGSPTASSCTGTPTTAVRSPTASAACRARSSTTSCTTRSRTSGPASTCTSASPPTVEPHRHRHQGGARHPGREPVAGRQWSAPAYGYGYNAAAQRVPARPGRPIRCATPRGAAPTPPTAGTGTTTPTRICPHSTIGATTSWRSGSSGRSRTPRPPTRPPRCGFRPDSRCWASNQYVAVNSAVAANVVGDRVEVRLNAGVLTLLINGNQHHDRHDEAAQGR